MYVRSIRSRFLLWLAFLLVTVLSGLGVTAFHLHRAQEFARIDEELSRRVAALSTTVRKPPPPGTVRSSGTHSVPPPELASRALDEKPILLPEELERDFDPAAADRGLYFVIWSPAGAVRRQGAPPPPDLIMPERRDASTAIQTRTRGWLREAWSFTERGNCILVGRPIAGDLASLRRFAWLLVFASAAVLAVALGGGGWIVSRALHPVDEIAAAATRIAAGNLTQRINLAETDSELGRLGRVLNGTFSRLEAAFTRQQQFTADASHELRTPLAVLISEAQATLARVRPADEYRAALEVCLDTAQQMRRLTESLLALARFDASQEDRHLSRLDLAERARASVELVTPLAAARGIGIHCDFPSIFTRGDSDRLGQVITNLLTNAVTYNHEHGEIHIATRAENGHAILTVSDTGQGIAPEDLPHVFERFYRADKSRARPEGRCGLGLAICKAAVEALGGGITVSSKPGAGATFTVHLPEMT